MTACAALIPTKVNAATLSIRSLPREIRGEIQAKPGDLIDFIISLRPEKDSVVIPTGWVTLFDTSELSSLTAPQYLVSLNAPIAYDPVYRDKDIIRQRFKVLKPLKDGIGDVFATLSYDESGPLGNFTGLSISASSGDVVPQQPVPEPLTMLGAAAALGYGAILKRKYSKNTEF
jgi:hypothetical protein